MSSRIYTKGQLLTPYEEERERKRRAYRIKVLDLARRRAAGEPIADLIAELDEAGRERQRL